VLLLDSLLDTINPSDTKVSELVDEQRADETLSGAFEFAKQGKGGYFLKSGNLFHRTKILDNFVKRLVVPEGRRRALLKLAHDNLSCHLRVRRTKRSYWSQFLPRCMKCRRGLATRILSVCPPVCLSVRK